MRLTPPDTVAIFARELPKDVGDVVRFSVGGATYEARVERQLVGLGHRRVLVCPACERRSFRLFCGAAKGLACVRCHDVTSELVNASRDPVAPVLRARVLYEQAARLRAPRRVRDSARRRRARELEREADALVAEWKAAFEAECGLSGKVMLDT